MKQLFSSSYRFTNIRWQRVMEDSRMMRAMFNKIVLIITDGMTKELAIGLYLLARSVVRLCKKSGFLFTALYLKQCSASLMTYYGTSDKVVPTLLPVPVSLNRAGLPRIIPADFRKIISQRSEKSDIVVNLSAFSLSKICLVAKKVSRATFASMVTPPDFDPIKRISGQMSSILPRLIRRYIPRINSIPLHQGLKFVPTWKALPTTQLLRRVLMERLKVDKSLTISNQYFDLFRLRAFKC